MFGSTKHKLDLSSSGDCDSHHLDKVNHPISRPNTCANQPCIEESSNSTKYGVAHTTSMLEMDCTIAE